MLVCLWLVIPSPSQANWLSDWVPESLEVGGYLKNETAYRFKEPRTYTKIRNIVFLEANYPYSDRLQFTGSAWAYYDLAYDLFDYDSIAARSERDYIQPLTFVEGLAEEKDSPVADIRELYLDLFFDHMDLRIGKQFVIWGVLTGVRIVDEINPMDFREMILPDLLDYRVPLWTLKLDYYLEDSELQFLLIPDIQFHKPAPPGSEWELLQEVPNTVYPETFTPENVEYGLRWTKTLWDTEFALSYFYTWDDFPVIFRTIHLGTELPPPVFQPTYVRISMYGLTARRTVRGQVVKGEVAYVTGKYFGTGEIDRDQDGILDKEGELQKDHIRWGLGMDFNLWKIDFSPAITQWIILEYQKEIIQDQIDTAFNLFVRKELPEHGAVISLLAIALLNIKELYLKPKVTFNVTEHFQIAAGLDLMSGETSQAGVGAAGGRATDLIDIQQRFQFIGNFHDNDRLFLEFKYAF